MENKLLFLDPVRAGIAQALSRAIPVETDDKESAEERRILHRADLKERLK